MNLFGLLGWVATVVQTNYYVMPLPLGYNSGHICRFNITDIVTNHFLLINILIKVYKVLEGGLNTLDPFILNGFL